MNIFRIFYGVFRASMHLRRRARLNEFIDHEWMLIDKEQRRMFIHSVGLISIGWAHIETLLDYGNYFILGNFETQETQLPVSLKPKIAFFRKHFQAIPELEPYRDRAMVLVERINNLKEARHDVVHGMAQSKVREGLQEIIRLDYQGKRLIERSKKYSLDQVIETTIKIAELGDELTSFLREVAGARIGELFENPQS
jgi:hypothetical protein